jgi:DNA-binding transcriptional ArsR family regulator
MTDVDDLSDIASVLDDRYAREILAEASRRAVSATELNSRLDADISTIYRRLERLEALGLVSSRIEVSDDGHHYRQYRTRLRRITVDLVDGEFEVRIERVSNDLTDRLTDFFGGIY